MVQGREVEVKFRRDLGLLEITMIGLGPTIGTTIFPLVGPGFAITGPSLILAFGLTTATLFVVMITPAFAASYPGAFDARPPWRNAEVEPRLTIAPPPPRRIASMP